MKRQHYEKKLIDQGNEHMNNARIEKSRQAALRKVAGSLTLVTMRRIVELEELAKYMWCSSCDLPLSFRHFVSEKQVGIASVLMIRCFKCDSLYEVPTGKRVWENNGFSYAMNSKAALGKEITLLCLFVPAAMGLICFNYDNVFQE